LVVTPPSWRFDIQIEEDLIEEVARVRGFHLLPDTPPIAPVRARPRPEARRGAHALRHALAELDYQETINFSFVDETWERDMAGNADPIRVRNPIAAHLAVMRSSLIASLVAVLKYNLDRRTTRVRVFEVGRVFSRAPDVRATGATVSGIAQPTRLAGLAYGAVNQVQWGTTERRVDFFDVKGDVEMLLAPRAAVFSATSHPALHPGRSASISAQGRTVGVIGELHPRWCQANELAHAPVVFELDFDPLLERPVPHFAAVARQQSVWRDLAVVVPDSVSHDALLGIINDDPTGTIRGATLFDVYRAGKENTDIGAGNRSMAMRIEMLDERAPLTDERVNATMQGALKRVQQLGGRLRA
jgi:phenylalanyl-tRNA synthetase beta chain